MCTFFHLRFSFFRLVILNIIIRQNCNKSFKLIDLKHTITGLEIDRKALFLEMNYLLNIQGVKLKNISLLNLKNSKNTLDIKQTNPFLNQKVVVLNIVDKAVEKLWKSCGQSCGQLGYKDHLWIAVDKLNTYPQAKSIYPQFYPHAVLRPIRNNYLISTVSTAPTIYRWFPLNLFRFASLVE